MCKVSVRSLCKSLLVWNVSGVAEHPFGFSFLVGFVFPSSLLVSSTFLLFLLLLVRCFVVASALLSIALLSRSI